MAVEIKNLEKAGQRIRLAVDKKEIIIIYGDSDLDGVASVVILEECLKNLGADGVVLYFFDREKEGYGINEKALKKLKKYSPALFITLDCGIGNFKEVIMANNLGFEVIIIDHHEILGKVPEASIVIDPKQEGDEYPFKKFANVGITFRLAVILLKDALSEGLRKSFLELTALATIADMMPRTDDNEKMIEEGLSDLRQSWRPGLQALLNLEPIKLLPFVQQISKINSFLNIRDIKNDMPAAFRLLTASKPAEAEKLAKKLFEKGVEKKKKTEEVVEQVENRIGDKDVRFILEGDSKWELILLGTAASVLSQKYQKPFFLYSKGKVESDGSCRAPADCNFNLVEAMQCCSKFLLSFGGHPQAGGFKIKNKELDEFKTCLTKYFNNK
jgi:single-stranded-DNA-specific exonuclease